MFYHKVIIRKNKMHGKFEDQENQRKLNRHLNKSRTENSTKNMGIKLQNCLSYVSAELRL